MLRGRFLIVRSTRERHVHVLTLSLAEKSTSVLKFYGKKSLTPLNGKALLFRSRLLRCRSLGEMRISLCNDAIQTKRVTYCCDLKVVLIGI